MARAFLIGLVVLTLAVVLVSGQAAPALTLTSPAGGESWAAGSTHVVSWTNGSPTKAILNIAYSTDGGRSWTDAGKAPATIGKFLWKVPDKLTKQAFLRLTLPGAPSVQNRTAFAITPSQERNYRWTEVTKKATFAPRDGAGALTYQGKMWLLGGWNPGDRMHFPRICNNEVWNSRDGITWTLVKPNTFLDRTFDPTRDWEGRHTAGYVVFKNRMWIVGGDVNQGHYHDDVWNSTDGKTWTLVNKGKKVPWGPRALHYTVVHGDRIWVLGGQTVPQFAASGEVFYRDIWTSADGLSWEQIKPKEPFWSARGMIGGSAVFKGRVWVLGGGTYDTPKVKSRNFYNDVWSTSDGVAWTRHVEQAPWHPRQYHEVAVYDDRLWVMEGYHANGGNRNDVWYCADGVNWYEVPKTPWRPRHAASVYVHDGALWMVAGNNMQSDVWKLQLR
jgi:hypothetical protein